MRSADRDDFLFEGGPWDKKMVAIATDKYGSPLTIVKVPVAREGISSPLFQNICPVPMPVHIYRFAGHGRYLYEGLA